ncbi:MAG: peptidoglycan-associated lipoprotein Pal [Deltaproteobacteria bacterium]|nr:peptidoglycan-associated lipoprotein Pal [Deltaproteobacteria bacterium]
MNASRLVGIGSLILAVFVLSGCPPKWPQCKKDDHCKKNADGEEVSFVCIAGQCVECGTDADCSEGFICRENACVPKPECLSSADCSGGMLCKNEKCVPECTSASDCASGMKCEGSRCVPDVECSSNSDCAEGEECDADGKCVAAAVPECSVQTVYFDFDSSELTSSTRSTLEANADCLKQKGVRVTLQGHADERGTEEYNLALGEKRADAARKYLSNLGVSDGLMKVVSFGEERPANPGSDEGAWAENRRVELDLDE